MPRRTIMQLVCTSVMAFTIFAGWPRAELWSQRPANPRNQTRGRSGSVPAKTKPNPPAGGAQLPSSPAVNPNARQSPTPSQQLAKTTDKLTSKSYVLAYQYTPGQVLRYNVMHVVNVETQIEGSGQKSQSRSAALKRWNVQEVAAGKITLSHTIEEVDMSSESPGRQPVRYNSRTDKEVPGEYEEVAATIGKPLAVVTVDTHGNLLDRKDETAPADLGIGGFLVPLPKEPVPLNTEWSQPGMVNVRLSDGEFKVIKTRQVYRLQQVASGIATITLTTQVMTPVPDARVQSQLLQRLCNGEIKFDLDAGRIVSRTMEWNENVVGFNGASSSMKYQARLTEEWVDDPRVATRPASP